MSAPTPNRARRIGPASAALLALRLGCGDGTSPGGNGGGTPLPPDTVRDADMLDAAQLDSTWSWWERSDSLLDRAGESPHSERIRVRYNVRAATQLDSAGRVASGAYFPDSSTIVKEIFAGGTATGIVVMYKVVDAPNAGHGGWLWAEYDASSRTLHSATADETYCHDCHVAGLDHTRMNDTH